jgi:hypothetical protein
MSLILLATAAILLLAAGVCHMSALEEVRPKLPASLQDPLSSRFALDAFIWDRSVPATIRRTYLRSLVCGSLALGCLAAFVFVEGDLFAALLFAAVFIFAIGHTLTRWAKHRRLR